MLQTIIAPFWDGYELLDSGEGERLERFGIFKVVRPDANALWARSDRANWKHPDAHFIQGEKGQWDLKNNDLKDGWVIEFGKARFRVAPTSFRHMGLFPEQAAHWQWLQDKIPAEKPIKVLNLFAYTGGASIIAAQAGAKVTHVDASQGSINWAKENAALSGLPSDAIRWICDDVPKFLAREIRRGSRYDLILLDPPVFGRGPKGEIWRLENGLQGLLSQVAELLSPKPAGVLMNFYATTLYPEAVARLAAEILQPNIVKIELASLCLQESRSKNLLPTGYFIRS